MFFSFLKNDLTYSFTLSCGMKLDYIPFKINITEFDIVYSWIEIRFVCLRGNFWPNWGAIYALRLGVLGALLIPVKNSTLYFSLWHLLLKSVFISNRCSPQKKGIPKSIYGTLFRMNFSLYMKITSLHIYLSNFAFLKN